MFRSIIKKNKSYFWGLLIAKTEIIDYRPGTSTEGANAKSLRETLDKLKTCIIVLAAVDADTVTLIAGVIAYNLKKIT